MGADIFIEADSAEELRTQVRDVVLCNFDEGKAPSLIRPHITRQEVLAA